MLLQRIRVKLNKDGRVTTEKKKKLKFGEILGWLNHKNRPMFYHVLFILHQPIYIYIYKYIYRLCDQLTRTFSASSVYVKGGIRAADVRLRPVLHRCQPEFIATDHLIYVALKTSGQSAFLSRYTEVGG